MKTSGGMELPIESEIILEGIIAERSSGQDGKAYILEKASLSTHLMIVKRA